jgi:hypothetical protein
MMNEMKDVVRELGLSHGSTSRPPQEALRALLQKVPELGPVLMELADWLTRAVSAAVAERPSHESPESERTAPATEESFGGSDQVLAPALLDACTTGEVVARVSLSAPESAVALPPVADPPVTADQLAALLLRFNGTPVAPRVATPSPVAPPVAVPTADPSELRRLQRHFEMQRAAIDWCIRRDNKGFAAVKEPYHRLRERGEAEQCFMWALDQGVTGHPAAELQEVAEWYQLLCDAIEATLEDEPGNVKSRAMFGFVVRACQAVRLKTRFLAALGLRDQGLEDLRGWYARAAHSFGIGTDELNGLYGNQFTRGLQPAREEFRQLSVVAEERARKKKLQISAVNKFKYELRRWLGDPSGPTAHVDGMLKALESLTSAGGSADGAAFVAQVNDVLGAGALPQQLIESADGQRLAMGLAALHEADEDGRPDAESDDALEDHVLRAREALRGKVLVLVGGDERPQRRDAIMRAFQLSELRWVATRPHERHDNLLPFVRRDDAAAVLLLIRWSSHSYAALREECDEHDKPLVRLPGGYSPSAIAHEFLNQAGKRFGLN